MLLFVYLLFFKELSAVTGQTIINDISCYNAEDKGTSYNGKINTTINGKTCLNWKKYDSIYALYYEDHNYCRNPLPKELDKPWCYTGEGLKHEYCNIPVCGCRASLHDLRYNGHISKTRNGTQCKAWTETKYPSEENNYCRTPDNDQDNDGGPWCYDNSLKKWNRCNVPVCHGKFCPDLSRYGLDTLDGKSKYQYGETAVVFCKRTSGSQTVLICQPNGKWNLPIPNCEAVDCAHLTVSADVKPSKQMHKFNDNVVLSCKEGYLQNSISIKCYANGSWPTDRPNCKPTDCAPLILSPRFKPLNQRPKFNDNVTLSCMEGYLGSSITIKCYANGYWPTKRPDCKPINCAPLLVSPHVEPLKQSQRPKFNDNVTLSCVEGYIGSSITIKCYANGYWPTDRPNCEPGDCVSLDVGDHVKLSKQMPKFNDNVTLYCEKGYLGDSISIKCFANGSWPTDRPSCKPITCSMLTVDDQISKSENISRYNDNVTLSCKEGYIGAPVILKCNANGVWLSQRPNCTEKSQSFEDSMEKRCTCMSYGLFGGTLAVVVAISAGIHIATCFYFRKRGEKSATVYEDMQFKTVERQKGSNEETYTELT